MLRSRALLATGVLVAAVTVDVGARAEAPPGPQPEGLLTISARSALPDETVSVGLLEQAAVGQIVSAVCGSDEVKKRLPSTCEPSGAGSLIALRDRLVRDVGSMPAAFVRSEGGAAGIATAVLETALDGPTVERLAQRLAGASAKVADARNLAALAPAAKDDALGIAARIIARAAHDLEAAAPTPEQIEEGARAVLEAHGLPTALDEKQKAAVKELSDAIGAARAAEKKIAASARDAASWAGLGSTFVRVADRALAVVGKALNIPATLGPLLDGTIAALVAGDLRRAIESQADLLKGTGSSAVLSPDAIRHVGCAIDFVRAKDEADRKRVVRRCVANLPPWTEPILVDVSIGTAVVDLAQQNYKLAGDFLLGYNADRWGVLGRAQLAAYEYTVANANLFESNDSSQYTGTLEGWLTTDPAKELRFEGRLLVGAGYYDTTRITTRMLLDDTSVMGRGSLTAGVRYQTPRVAAGAWLGGGVQYEDFKPSLTVDFYGSKLTSTEGTKVTPHAQLRVRFVHQTFPGILALRARVDSSLFAISRTRRIDNGTTAVYESTKARQIDSSARIYIDGEFARFFGFLPHIGGGVDLFMLSSDEASKTTLVPIVQAGVTRETF
jgi:hypothetical protein